jgi:hypothetical protein
MRTPRTKAARTNAARTKAVLTKAGVSSVLATTLLGTGLLVTMTPAAAADSPYKAAVSECLAGSPGGATLRDCLQALAPRRTPRVVEQEPATTESRPASKSKSASKSDNQAAPAESAPVADPAPANDAGSDSDAWSALRECEASGDYGLNDGSSYYGAYQFDLGTWQELGYDGYPNQASPAVQDEAARQLQSQRGWQPWPACSRKLGLR